MQTSFWIIGCNTRTVPPFFLFAEVYIIRDDLASCTSPKTDMSHLLFPINFFAGEPTHMPQTEMVDQHCNMQWTVPRATKTCLRCWRSTSDNCCRQPSLQEYAAQQTNTEYAVALSGYSAPCSDKSPACLADGPKLVA